MLWAQYFFHRYYHRKAIHLHQHISSWLGLTKPKSFLKNNNLLTNFLELLWGKLLSAREIRKLSEKWKNGKVSFSIGHNNIINYVHIISGLGGIWWWIDVTKNMPVYWFSLKSVLIQKEALRKIQVFLGLAPNTRKIGQEKTRIWTRFTQWGLTLFFPMFPFDPPENIWKLKVTKL